MTEVLQSFPSPSSCSSSPCVSKNDIPHPQEQQHGLISPATGLSQDIDHGQVHELEEENELGVEAFVDRNEREREGDRLSLLAILVAACRRSIIGCSITASKELCRMEIGLPTNVRHVAHVTFDRFNGFLGLPAEFEPEIPRRAPSASATVFGVSTESMQLSYDSRGNSVPTILLMMQRNLYSQGGLQAEGIFRINAENDQEEYVRGQLNRGVVPEEIDVHCLAGLIKAWFRELPVGVLDSLLAEQVMQSQSEEECAGLVRLLPQTEAALLDWAINLMADVAQMEHLNKMNARNVAMVFAPNMTKMSDPLTALMYAVQVMNFLKTLIIRTLREREETVVEPVPGPGLEPSDENGHQSSSQPACQEVKEDSSDGNEEDQVFVREEPGVKSPGSSQDSCTITENGSQSFLTSIENIPGVNRSLANICPCDVVSQVNTLKNDCQESGLMCKSRGVQSKSCRNRKGQSTRPNPKKGTTKRNEQPMIQATVPAEKGKRIGIAERMNPRTELFEAWR